ncbi:MAG: replicative DNA helicase [Candidatus Paceibacterota bacterium]|jgi:replicative DNA helicase
MSSENTNLKVPPQDIEAEKSLLGSLMLDKEAITKVADILHSEDFYKRNHQYIYQVVEDLFTRGEPIDLISVSSKLKERNQLENMGGTAYLTELINTVPTASHVMTYAKIVQKKRILRDLISAGTEISLMGYEEENESDDLLDSAERKIFGITQKNLTQSFLPIKPYLEEAFERIEKISKQKGALRGISTGFNGLDSLLSGLQASDLIILAARPSMGKSSLALDIAKNVALKEKKAVGIFSLEMSKDQLIDRLISSESNIDSWKLRQGMLSADGEQNDFVCIQHALGTLSEAPIFIDDASSCSVLQMRAMARRLQASHGLGLIVIDYLQLIEPNNKIINSVQQITEISRQLKGLARELNIPVLALSQLSRAVEQRTPKVPRLSDLRDSGCLAGETLITLADTGEMISIKNLAERKEQISVNILAMDEDYKVKSATMSKAFYSGKKIVYELTTRSGRKIKASANHPFYKLEGWKRLDELKEGDCIALPRSINIENPKNELKDNELILLAHLLGDGCILPHQPFHYTNAYEENIETVRRVAEELFGIKGRIIRQENWYHIYLSSPYRLARNKHHPITNWFNDLNIGLVHSYDKVIPEKVFSCDKSKIALFLRNLWATDGNLSFKKTEGRMLSGSIYYATTSSKMAMQVQHLLLMLGIQSTTRKSLKEGYRNVYNISIQDSQNQLRFLSFVGINDRRKDIVPQIMEALNKIIPNPNNDIIPKEVWRMVVGPKKEEALVSWRGFADKLDISYNGAALLRNGISRERMSRISFALKDSELSKLANSDIYWDKVDTIKELGLEDVYDAMVEGLHNFVANDMVVHNSIEQDADVVLFIYREDVYQEESPRKGVADIIIAKHRNGPIGRVELFFDKQRACFRNIETGRDAFEGDIGY